MSRYGKIVNMDSEWESLLDQSYHHLCRSVRPEAFYSWLRSKGALSLDDQEEVENKYVTTVMKTGHLIDKIKTKGCNGFKAFMEVVEYVYPDTYNIITGKNARNPPSEFNPATSGGGTVEKRGPALSTEILGEMGNLVNVLSQANLHKKEELVKLQTYVNKLQKENDTMCEENRAVLQKFKDSQVEIEELKQTLDDLSGKHECDTKENKKIVEECERLRELKDRYMEESRKLRLDRDKLESTKSAEYEFQRSYTCRTPGSKATKDETDTKIKEWQNNYAMLQERYDCIVKDLEDVRAERNQMIHRLEQTQSMYEKEMETNKRLNADCNQYQDKFYKMEDQITLLYKEIEQLQKMQSPEITDHASNIPSLASMLSSSSASPTLLSSAPPNEEQDIKYIIQRKPARKNKNPQPDLENSSISYLVRMGTPNHHQNIYAMPIPCIF